MIKIKFQNTEQYIEAAFSRIGENVVQLLGEIPASTLGFYTYRNEVTEKVDSDGKTVTVEPTKLGDFTDYTTIYRVLDNGVQFSNDGSVYENVPLVPMEISLEQCKLNKLAQLKNARDKEELSPIAYGNYWWDYDAKSFMRIQERIVELEQTQGTISWTLADNQEINGVSADMLRGVIAAAAVRSNALHVKYKELKAEVERADSIEQLESIVW